MKHEEYSWNTSDRLTLFGQVWQPEDEPRGVIALVHGLGEHSGRYQPVAGRFCQLGLATISFDLRGHGRSEGKRGHIPSYETALDDIDHLLSEAALRFPQKPRFLYGHSLGGALVLYHLMRRAPDVAGAIVTSPGLEPGNAPGALLAVARLLDRLAPSFTMANQLDVTGLSHDQRILDAYRQDPLVHGRISVRLALQLIDCGRWVVEHAAGYPDIPLLLLQGKADRLVSPGAVARFASQVRGPVTYHAWDQLYHELHHEPEKEEVFAVMQSWLETRLR